MPSIVTDRRSGLSASLAVKVPCRLATTANISLSGYQTIDGVLPTSSDTQAMRRILVKNQTDTTENGIYIMDTGTWERAKDFDTFTDFVKGTRIPVHAGTVGQGWYTVSSAVTDTSVIDTDVITFSQIGVDSLNIDTDATLAIGGDSDMVTPSQLAVKTYIDALPDSVNLFQHKGAIDCSSNPNYPAANKGHAYLVGVAGLIGGGSGASVSVGALLVCNTDSTAAGTHAGVGANWTIYQPHDADLAAIAATSFSQGDMLYHNGTSLTRIALGSVGQVLSVPTTGSIPAWEDRTWSPPGGRLTLATATPVMTTTQSAKTTIYYTPAVSRNIPLWNGSTFVNRNLGGELSQDTTDNTKSPAACTTNSNYDLFVWDDAGTLRLSRGPAWSSDTSRGTGAGTTELNLLRGVYVNNNAITNGPAQYYGTYVGTVRTNGSSQVDWRLGASASGGTAAFLGVWNAYNRVRTTTIVRDSTTSWPYGVATWRSSNNSTGMRASFVLGIATEPVEGRFSTAVQGAASQQGKVSIAYDATNAPYAGASIAISVNNVSSDQHLNAFAVKESDIGFHYMQALESNVAGTCVFYGATYQSHFAFTGMF